jgi:hypothetical protein
MTSDEENEKLNEQYFKDAKEKFGNKVVIDYLHIGDRELFEFNQQKKCNLTQWDFRNYGRQVWMVDNKCPICGADLFGILGSFSWLIKHGIGTCSACKKIEFRLYHYLGKGDEKVRLELLSIVEF